MDSYVYKYTDSKIIRILVTAGVDITVPLTRAASGCDVELLEILIDACDKPLKETGEDALLAALSYGYLKNTKLLLQAGATISSNDMYEIITVNIIDNNEALIKLLLEYIPIPRFKNLNTLASLSDDRFKNLKLLMIETQSTSVLMHACKFGRFKIAKLLMKYCELNQVDTKGKTALDYAIEKGNDELISFLKQAGAC